MRGKRERKRCKGKRFVAGAFHVQLFLVLPYPFLSAVTKTKTEAAASISIRILAREMLGNAEA